VPRQNHALSPERSNEVQPSAYTSANMFGYGLVLLNANVASVPQPLVALTCSSR
jgi:hypothetical protein